MKHEKEADLIFYRWLPMESRNIWDQKRRDVPSVSTQKKRIS